MEDFEREITLMENFLARMDFQEKQGTWILKGSITRSEKEALNTSLRITRDFNKGKLVRKGS